MRDKIIQDLHNSNNKGINRIAKEIGLTGSTQSADLTDSQRIAVMQLYSSEIVGPFKAFLDSATDSHPEKNDPPENPADFDNSLHYLDHKLGDKKLLSAIFDTIYREGGPDGITLIQKAVNDVFRETNSGEGQNSSQNKEIKVDGGLGSKAIGALVTIVSNPEHRNMFLNVLADRRIQRHPNSRGERSRANYFRP